MKNEETKINVEIRPGFDGVDYNLPYEGEEEDGDLNYQFEREQEG